MGITLTVLAAGMGSRFGERIKQLEPVGPSGELLIDYSVRDAVDAGFDKVVFIIRRDIEELFKETIGNRISKLVNTEYVYQDIRELPCRMNDFSGRTKPWGTAQALYCCKSVINENFGVINADDYYGRESFRSLAVFLKTPDASACSVGFVLKNTLSDHGTVNRGICRADENGLLVTVEETKKIQKDADGVIRGLRNGSTVILDENDIVSMSMWGFTPDFMNRLSGRFNDFICSLNAGDISSELTIADAADREIKEMGYDIRNIPTQSKWYGITYEADVELVRQALKNR
ncbi:MAG: sugar phosphate nucleotidyltransferase [Oscillospiraceae bacterium]|nr:sugar phosphate nucleotidyltransferase [Oscillospiraceae bacterium]MDY6208933.1 sugar phosphate nucleotidyltransferase [Oscillospiraceae bacterium]